MKAHKRKHKRQIRKGFKKRCNQLAQRVTDIGFTLRYTRVKNQLRSETYFCLFQNGSVKVLFGGSIEEMEEHIDHYYKLKAFL